MALIGGPPRPACRVCGSPPHQRAHDTDPRTLGITPRRATDPPIVLTVPITARWRQRLTAKDTTHGAR